MNLPGTVRQQERAEEAAAKRLGIEFEDFDPSNDAHYEAMLAELDGIVWGDVDAHLDREKDRRIEEGHA